MEFLNTTSANQCRLLRSLNKLSADELKHVENNISFVGIGRMFMWVLNTSNVKILNSYLSANPESKISEAFIYTSSNWTPKFIATLVILGASLKEHNILRLAKDCSVESIKFFIELGVDVNTDIEEYWSLLEYAVVKNRIDLVEMLLSCGAEVSRVANEVVIDIMSEEMYSVLENAGVNMFVRTCTGHTIHTRAAETKRTEFIKFLRVKEIPY